VGYLDTPYAFYGLFVGDVMAANVGRTTAKWMKVQIEDATGTMRDIPISDIQRRGEALYITGPFDTSPLQEASGSGEMIALSGSHTVLSGLAGDDRPLSFAIYYGIRHAWEIGEPVYGLSSDSNNGMMVTDYTVNPDGFYSATVEKYPGSACPQWGTTFDRSNQRKRVYMDNYDMSGFTKIWGGLPNNNCPYCDTEDITPIPALVPGAPDTCPNCGGWLE
jgi:hypothetical protein